MVRPKKPKEIETLAKGGQILAELLGELNSHVRPGAVPRELDQIARDLIAARGVTPSFLGYVSGGHRPFPAALCVSVNSAVVHGLPSEEPLREGDLVGLDLGIVYQGLYLDSAHTVPVGDVSAEGRRLLNVTKQALAIGIKTARLGNTTGDMGAAIQEYVEGQGYSVVRQLVGHGVGYAVHEEPRVPNFGSPGEGERLVEGLVIAIEPMVVVGNPAVETSEDGWTVATSSGNLAAHEEHTVAITKEGPRILTLETRN